MAKIVTTMKVEPLTQNSWILFTYHGNCKEIIHCNHSSTNNFAKFLNLLPYISQKGVAQPLTNEHDSENRNLT